MGLRLILVAMACCLAAPLAAATKDREPEVLARSGKWEINYDRDACHLYAQFGKGDDMVVARFTRYQPGDYFDLALYGNRFRSFQAKAEAKVDFGLKEPSGEERAIYGSTGKLATVFLNALRFDGYAPKSRTEVPPKITPEQEASVHDLTVAIGSSRPLKLEFGSLGRPLIQMRQCLENLLKSWGYDPTEQAMLLRPVSPVNSLQDWLVPADYPFSAMQGGHNGTVQFRLDVDAKGEVVGCFVLARTSPDIFADLTCRGVVKRAKLQPALNALGQPVRSYYVQKVHWQARPD